MRKILWLYFLRQESIQMIKIFLWYLLIYILMERGSGALFFYILIQWGKWDGGKKDIPKSMVILPFHGKERNLPKKRSWEKYCWRQ